MIQKLVFANKSEAAAELPGTAGIAQQLEAPSAHRKLGFDNFHGSDACVGLIDVGSRNSILAAAPARATAEYFILHVASARFLTLAADDNRAAAAAIGDFFCRCQSAEGFKQSFYQSVHGRVIGIDRRRKAGIQHSAVAELHIDDPDEALIDRQSRVDQGREAIRACRPHHRGANVGRSFGLVGAAAEVEEEIRAFLLDPYVDAHGFIKFDAVAVNEPLSLACAIAPACDLALDPALREIKERGVRVENSILAVLVHQLLKALFAETVGPYLAAHVADHKLGRAAVGADDAFNVATWLVAVNVFDWRQMQPFLINLPCLAPTASGNRPTDIAFVGDAGGKAHPLAAVEDRRQHRHVGRVRAAAQVRMVGDESVPFMNLL